MANSITVILGRVQTIDQAPTTASTLSGPSGAGEADCGPASNGRPRKSRPKPPQAKTSEARVTGRDFTRKVRTTIIAPRSA